MRTFPADIKSPTRREEDSFPLTGLPQRPVKCLVINRLDLAMEVFERSLEPADDDDEDDADTEADDEDGDEDGADTDEHEHGGEA
jgi:hypothetical protein